MRGGCNLVKQAGPDITVLGQADSGGGSRTINYPGKTLHSRYPPADLETEIRPPWTEGTV